MKSAFSDTPWGRVTGVVVVDNSQEGTPRLMQMYISQGEQWKEAAASREKGVNRVQHAQRSGFSLTR